MLNANFGVRLIRKPDIRTLIFRHNSQKTAISSLDQSEWSIPFCKSLDKVEWLPILKNNFRIDHKPILSFKKRPRTV